MKVILNQTVPKVGKQGQVVNVADGFARNFLFPRGLAIVADKTQLEVLGRREAKLKAASMETLSAAQTLGERLEGKTVRIEGKVGQAGSKLFGAITAQDVADALKAQHKVEVERKNIGLVEPIKRVGKFPIVLDLHRDVEATITVDVFDPNAPVEVEAPVEAPAEAEAEAEAVAV